MRGKTTKFTEVDVDSICDRGDQELPVQNFRPHKSLSECSDSARGGQRRATVTRPTGQIRELADRNVGRREEVPPSSGLVTVSPGPAALLLERDRRTRRAVHKEWAWGVQRWTWESHAASALGTQSPWRVLRERNGGHTLSSPLTPQVRGHGHERDGGCQRHGLPQNFVDRGLGRVPRGRALRGSKYLNKKRENYAQVRAIL